MEFGSVNFSPLEIVPNEVLQLITQRLTHSHILALYLCGSSRLNAKLRSQGAVMRLHVVFLTPPTQFLNFILEFKKLISLGIIFNFHSYSKRSHWQATTLGSTLKVSMLPPTLTSLKLRYSCSFVSLSSLMLEVYDTSSNNSPTSWMVAAKAEKQLIADPKLFLDIGALLPRLKAISLEVSTENLWKTVISILPSSVTKLNTEYTTLTPTLATALPSHLTYFRSNSWTNTLDPQILMYLQPTLQTLLLPSTPLTSMERAQELARFRDLSRIAFYTVHVSVLPLLPPQLTVLDVRYWERRNKDGSMAPVAPIHTLPRGLLRAVLGWGCFTTEWRELPPKLHTLMLYGKVEPEMAETLRNLPSAVTKLKLSLTQTPENFVKTLFSCLPPTLAYLELNLLIRDNLLHLLPKSVTSLSCSQLQPTGRYLKTDAQIITPKHLIDPIHNDTKYRLPLIPNMATPEAPVDIYECPPHVTRLEYFRKWKMAAKDLPRGLVSLPRAFELQDLQDVIRDLPPGLRRIWSPLELRLASWMLLPTTLTSAPNASVRAEDADLDFFISTINTQDSSSPFYRIQELHFPETLRQVLWPKERFVCPCPKQWSAAWQMRHLEMLPSHITSLTIEPLQFDSLHQSLERSSSPPPTPLPETLQSLVVHGCKEVATIMTWFTIPKSLTRLELDLSQIFAAKLPANLPPLPALKQLYLSWVVEKTVKGPILDFWKTLPPSLTKLTLLDCQIALPEIVYLPSGLLDLEIRGENFTKDVITCSIFEHPSKFPSSLTRLHLDLYTLKRPAIDVLPISITDIGLTRGSEFRQAQVMEILKSKREALKVSQTNNSTQNPV